MSHFNFDITGLKIGDANGIDDYMALRKISYWVTKSI